MTDPYAQAAEQQTGEALGVPATADDNGAELALFGGEPLPSIFNKSHGLNVKVTGVIRDTPFQRHSRTFSQNGAGKLRYWKSDNTPTTDAVDSVTRKENRPIMDTVIPADTEYRDQKNTEDKGVRGFYLGGEDLKAVRAAIKVAKVPNMAALKGMRLTMWRSGTRPTGKGNDAWLYTAEITPA